MIRHTLIFLMIAIVVSGCFRKVPLPYSYQGWKKSGANEFEVQKALLECGYDSPIGGGPNDLNPLALCGRCMEKAGFIDESYMKITRGKTFCEMHRNLPNCQLPLDQTPDRNVTKRLNSEWCTVKFPNAKACQP